MYQKNVKKLNKSKKELSKRLKGIKKSLTTQRSKDWEDAAIESENDEVLQGIYSEISGELLLIDHAIQRIKQDKYGVCEQCDAEINKKRLKIMPYTSLCINCAQKLELKYA
jgi:RNA polymerase-binding transcription factor DksA